METQPDNNYAPPKSQVADAAAVADQDLLASRWARLGAAFIDGIIIGVPLWPASLAFQINWMGAAQTPAQRAVFARWYGSTASLFVPGLVIGGIVLAVTAYLVHKNGQTIGKKLLGIKVVRKDGSRASFARIFWLRNIVNILISLVPVLGRIYALADSLRIFGGPRRCIHDYIADTIVIKA